MTSSKWQRQIALANGNGNGKQQWQMAMATANGNGKWQRQMAMAMANGNGNSKRQIAMANGKWQMAMATAMANVSSGQQTMKEVEGSMLDGWRGFGVARGRSALARGVGTHDIIPTPPFRILLLTSSEKVSLFRSLATILGRKFPPALSKLGYSARVGSPTMCGVFLMGQFLVVLFDRDVTVC